MFALYTKAQTFYLHAEYRNDWYNGAYVLTTDIAGYAATTVQAQTQADQFVIENNLGANRWRKFGTAVFNVPAPYVYYPNNPGIGDNYFEDSTTVGYYYTTRFKDLGNSSTNGVIMQTSGAPVSISGATQSPAVNSVAANSPVIVTVTLASARSAEELFFVRYTNDGWATSTAIPVTFTGSSALTGTASIPAQTANTSVSYYIMSSTVDVSSYTPTSDYDLVTLKLNNNGGVNYSYTATAPVVTAPITFRVNMNGTTVGSGVFLAGSFNAFSATANPMLQIGTTGVYEATVNIDTTATVTYKFVNGTTYETVPTTCSVNDGSGNFNRSLVVPNSATTLTTVCYAACNNACQPTVVVTAPITFRVNMSQQTVTSTIYLAGTFNGFSATANPMTQIGTTGVYEATVSLDTTATVAYKFVNGTQYETVPTGCGVDDGLGNINRSLTVPNAATTLSTVCYGNCVNCAQPTLVNVTFRLNMAGQTVSSNGVYLTGSFNNFNVGTNPMVLSSGTVYEATVALDTTATVTYKFVNGTAFELVPQACGVLGGFGQYDRSLSVPNSATTLPIVCFSACDNACQPAPVVTIPITFRVNMNGTTIGSGGVHIAGTFNGFSRTANAMTQVGTTSVYEATLQLDTTATHYYKFLKDTSNAGWETIPASCGFTFSNVLNRKLDVPNSATTLATVCYNLCDNSCQPVVIPTAAITFRVNMSTSTVGSGVFLAGSFNAFSATANPMTQIGTTGVYEATVNLDTTATVTYKFVNGTTYESVSSTCGVSDGFGGFNRSLVVPNSATTLATVCLNSCTNCPVPFLVPVTFYLNMTGTTVGNGGVHIAGTFNNFSRTATPMIMVQPNIYKVTIDLDTTATHFYKYLSDTTNAGWENVPAACGFTYQNVLNRKLVVPETAFGLPTICFNACDNSCAPVVIVTTPITFKVNMNGTTVGTGVFLAGSFNAFSATANPMTQIGTTGVYEATVSIDTTATVNYKFVNGTQYETVPTTCSVNDGSGNFNRSLVVPNSATTLPTVCYNLCDNSCQPVPVVTAPITFRVNMSTSTVGSGVYLAGSFNGFSATANPMTQIGTTGVYEATVNIDTTATVTYKFVNGTIYETVPTACSVNDGSGNFNRSLVAPNSATTLPTVCYASCSNCPVPFLVATTFRVNMAATTVGVGGVHIAGTFNGFSRTANAMTQIGTTGVYETTLQLDSTATHFYKFLKDTTNTGWETVPAACGFTFSNVLNRKIEVTGAASTLATICYSECSNCSTTVVVEINNQEVSIYPNPTQNTLNITNSKGAVGFVYDINGRELMQQVLMNEIETIDLSGLSKGIYFIKMVNNSTSKTIKFVKE